MERLKVPVMMVLAAIVVVSFFLPWVAVQSQEVGIFSKVLTGKAQVDLVSLSGFNVPNIANSQDSRLAISVIKIFDPKVTNANVKSYLVWLLPLFAIAVAAAFYFLGENQWVNLVAGAICALIFIVGMYKIATTDMNKLVLNVVIGIGLWLTFYAYLGMGLVGIAGFVLLQKKK